MSSEINFRYWRDCESGRVDHWWHLSCIVLFLRISNDNTVDAYRYYLYDFRTGYVLNCMNRMLSKTHCAINDPLGQTHSSNHYFHLKIVLFRGILKNFDLPTDVQTDEWTTLVKIVITIGLDCGSDSWIDWQQSLVSFTKLPWPKCTTLSPHSGDNLFETGYLAFLLFNLELNMKKLNLLLQQYRYVQGVHKTLSSHEISISF